MAPPCFSWQCSGLGRVALSKHIWFPEALVGHVTSYDGYNGGPKCEKLWQGRFKSSAKKARWCVQCVILALSAAQMNHKANEDRKNCILEMGDVQGHAENLRSKSRNRSNPVTPRRFVIIPINHSFIFLQVQKLFKEQPVLGGCDNDSRHILDAVSVINGIRRGIWSKLLQTTTDTWHVCILNLEH